MRLLLVRLRSRERGPDRILVVWHRSRRGSRRSAARRGCGTCACSRQCDGL